MATKKHRFTLKSTERLKHRKKIDALFTQGQKFSLGTIRVVYQFNQMQTDQESVSGASQVSPAPATASLLIGVGVSKRYFKKAVDRNRLKRLLRESARLEKIPLQESLERTGSGLDLFILYTGKEMSGFDQCREQVRAAFQRLIKKSGALPNNNEHP